MGYHECPIDPWDWNNGDGNAEEGKECPTCGGSGEVYGIVDGRPEQCPKCGGEGAVFPDPEDCQPEMDDVP